MSDGPNNNRVFILGAGFSKAAGMPLADELTTSILNQGFMLKNDEFRAWIDDIRNRINNLTGKGASKSLAINIEQLFEFAHFDRELFLMKQQEMTVGRHDGSTSYSSAESIGVWLQYMEFGLVDTLLNAQKNANENALRLFVEQLGPGDTVLTFNYDTILERCLTGSARSWNHGFDVEGQEGIRILKLHGSLDWWMLPRNSKLPGSTLLFRKEDHNRNEEFEQIRDGFPSDGEESPEHEYAYELRRTADLDTVAKLNKRYTGLSSGHPGYPGLGGLGSDKPLHRLVGSGATWHKAFGALTHADEVVVIGWSCSPYDIMARFHFASVMKQRKSPLERAIVVDPDAHDVAERVRPVLGCDVEVKEGKTEEVDWAQLLAERVDAAG